MSDDLKLGLSIVLDDKYLNEFNKIMNTVRQMQKQLESALTDPITKIRQPTVNLNSEFDKLNLKAKQAFKTVNIFGKSITQHFQQANGQIIQVTRNTDGTITRLKTINNSTNSIASAIGGATAKMLLWSSAGFLLFNTLRSIQDSFKTLVETETEIVNIRKVLPNDVDFAPLQKGAQIISQQFGVSITDTLKAMQSWARQFKDTNSIIQLTNASMLAAAVTDITLESSYKALSSIIKQFNMEVAEANHIVSTFNELSNNMRVSAEDLAQGLAKTGSAAKTMGVDFDRATGLVGTLVEVTSMSGSQAGTVLSRMFSRIHTDEAVAELKKLNIDAFQPMSKTLDELGMRWDSLTSLQQENIAKALGGTHHYQKLLALFSNYNRVIEATIMSFNSMGSAEKEMELAMSTFQKKLEQLKASFQSLAVNIGNSMLPAVKDVIDGFRILITYQDGIIPKLALVAAGIWGLVAAYKALAAVQSITLTGWLGIGAALVTGAAYFVGMANSSKQATDTLTKLNNSIDVVNNSMNNLSNASQRVKQVEYLSEVHEKLHTKLKGLNKGTQDYVDTLNLYKKVQNEINELGNQYGVKLGKGKSKYELERDQVSELITKLKELEEQKQRMYEKDIRYQIKQNQQVVKSMQRRTFGEAGSDFFDLKRYYYQAWQQRDKERIKRGREMTERWIRFNTYFDADQVRQQISAFRKDPTGWFKSMNAAYDQAQKNLRNLNIELTENRLRTADRLGKPETSPSEIKIKDTSPSEIKIKDRIQPIFTTLTAGTLELIEIIGRSWQDQINEALSPDEKLKNDLATYVLRGQEGFLSIPTKINNKMRNELIKIFENIDEINKDLIDSFINIYRQRNQLIETGEYDPQEEVRLQKEITKVNENYRKNLEEQYKALDAIRRQLKPSTNGFKELTKIMHSLNLQIQDAEVQYERQNKIIKQYNVLMNTIEGLCTVLDKFGDSTARASVDFIRSLSKVVTTQGGKLTFDWKNATKEQQANILTSGVNLLGQILGISTEEIDYATMGTGVGFALGGLTGGILGGALGLLVGSSVKKARKKIEAAQERANKATEAYNARMVDVNYGDVLSELASLQAELLTTPEKISYRTWYGKKKYESNPEYVALQEMIQSTQEAIRDMIINLSQNLRSAIADAFGATNNFIEFSQNLYSSVYDSVKEALLNAFVSSETMKPLFNNLSQLILDATLDGMLTAQEVINIRDLATDIGSRMRALSQSLGILDQYLGNLGGGSSSGSSGSYQASSSQSLVVNNYVSIYGTYFGEDEDGLREFSLLVARTIAEEQARA